MVTYVAENEAAVTSSTIKAMLYLVVFLPLCILQAQRGYHALKPGQRLRDNINLDRNKIGWEEAKWLTDSR